MAATSIAVIFLAVLFTCSVSADVIDESESTLGQALLDSMLSNYDKRVPPTGRGENKTQVYVKISMHVLAVEKVDDDLETFQVQVYFRQKWNDSRLRYDNKRTKVSLIYVKEDKIWRPDLFFTDGSKADKHDVIVPNVFTRLKPDGSILTSSRLTITFRCKMDLTNFPFDTQKCPMTAESYGYGVDMLDLGFDHSYRAISYGNDFNLKEYSLIDLQPKIESVTISQTTYKQLKVIFTFNRKTAFYTLRLFIPFLALMCLTWITFWINPQHVSLRLTLLLTALYLMVQISSDVNIHYITATAYIKGSDVWIGMCSALALLSLLEFVVVSLLSRKERGDCVRQVSVDPARGDVEAKKVEPERDSMTSSARFVAKSLANATSRRIDYLAKIVFPVTFILFNILYWSIYCSQ